MFQAAMSNSTVSEEATLSSFNPLILQNTNNIITAPPPKNAKKKRSLPGNPDPDAEVIALSPKSLLTTNRFICEICNKGFQRDQNLQLHRRGHNLPWKLKQRSNKDVVRKKAYVCPEPTCVHHHPSRALGDLTGIKKHFCRKHGEKKFRCDKCSKIYAVHSDWKAHSKTCGTREYRCECGTLFSRKDSFITHRAFCDALAEESSRLSSNPFTNHPILPSPPFSTVSSTAQNPNSYLFSFPTPWDQIQTPQNPKNPNHNPLIKTAINHPFSTSPPPFPSQQPPFAGHDSTQFLSATALLQKAVTMGPQSSTLASLAAATWGKNNEGFTRDFLRLAAGDDDGCHDHMLKFTGGLQYGMTAPCDGDNSSSSSSLLLFKLDDHSPHHQEVDDQEFGTFITAQPPHPTAAWNLGGVN